MATSVLIVDDSSVSRKILMRALPKAWTVSQAGNGIEAMQQYRASKPDLIFLDLNMPQMDGYQVLEALRNEPDRPPIIVLTGDIQPKAEERVMALGALAFVKKPLSEEGMAELLHKSGVQ
jgi:CheY-like chemotaxis protein